MIVTKYKISKRDLDITFKYTPNNLDHHQPDDYKYLSPDDFNTVYFRWSHLTVEYYAGYQSSISKFIGTKDFRHMRKRAVRELNYKLHCIIDANNRGIEGK